MTPTTDRGTRVSTEDLRAAARELRDFNHRSSAALLLAAAGEIDALRGEETPLARDQLAQVHHDFHHDRTCVGGGCAGVDEIDLEFAETALSHRGAAAQ